MLFSVVARFKGRNYLLKSQFGDEQSAQAAVRTWEKPFQPVAPGAFPYVTFTVLATHRLREIHLGGNATDLKTDLDEYDEIFFGKRKV